MILRLKILGPVVKSWPISEMNQNSTDTNSQPIKRTISHWGWIFHRIWFKIWSKIWNKGRERRWAVIIWKNSKIKQHLGLDEISTTTYLFSGSSIPFHTGFNFFSKFSSQFESKFGVKSEIEICGNHLKKRKN